MKQQKFSMMDCTVPVGNECLVPSKMEATAFFCLHHIHWHHIELMNLRTSLDEYFLAWCAMEDEHNINAIQPVFSLSESIKGVPITGQKCEINEYILYNNAYYFVCADPLYQMIIRQISFFAEQEHIEAVTILSGKKAIRPPDFYLVKITPVDNPHNVLSVSWLVIAETETVLSHRFFPIFWEDKNTLANLNFNSINWMYMDEKDIFIHDHLVYQVNRDNDDKLYVSKFIFGLSR